MEEFVWHPVEERILIKDVFSNGIKNYSIFYVNENYINIQNSSGNFTEKCVYQNGQLIAQINSNGAKQFMHSDGEGSTSLITDATGNVIENSYYSPFAETLSGVHSSLRYSHYGWVSL